MKNAKIAGVALWIWGVGVMVGAGGLAAIKMTNPRDVEISQIDEVKQKVRDKRPLSETERIPEIVAEKTPPIFEEFLAAIQDEQRSINEDALSSKTQAWGDRVRELEDSTLAAGRPELNRAIGRYRHLMQMAHINLKRLRNEKEWRRLVSEARKNGRATRPRIVKNEADEALSDLELEAEIEKLSAQCETFLQMTISDIEIKSP